MYGTVFDRAGRRIGSRSGGGRDCAGKFKAYHHFSRFFAHELASGPLYQARLSGEYCQRRLPRLDAY
jgi:hypothetical protein